MNQPQGPPSPGPSTDREPSAGREPLTDREPSTDVVEFGGSGPDGTRPQVGWLRRSAGLREPRIGWALGVLGAAALFGSLVGEWATTTFRYDEGFEESYVAGVGTAGNWGIAWMIGAMAVAAAVGICLAGPANLRSAARGAGLAVAGALLLLMLAAGVTISSDGLAFNQMIGALPGDLDAEVSLGRGLFAAYAALGLLAAALWLAPVPARAEGAAAALHAGPPWQTGQPGYPGQPGAPASGTGADLTVQPAEPFIHPTGDHEWR